MIAKENIQTNVKAENWREAIRIVGGLLEAHGSTTHRYAEAMIKAVEDLGPYMVILPHFALAHAAPSEEVLKDDTALITLEKPVWFGSSNDPVYVILAICAKDGKSHMDSLAQFAAMLMQENMISTLMEAKNSGEIFDIVRKNLSI